MLSLVFLALFGGVAPCPKVNPVAEFNITDYAQGKWYEIARYKHDVEKSADCVVFDFDEDGDHAHANMKVVVDKQAHVIRTSIFPTEEVGRIMFVFPKPLSVNITANILSTDHKNYVVFYYCSEDEPAATPTEVAWIVSRTPSLEWKATISKVVDESHILDGERLIWDHLTPEDCRHD